MFLLVVDMGERDSANDAPSVGINVRGWFGVKLVSIMLLIIFDL
jgi:hypothetical protein